MLEAFKKVGKGKNLAIRKLKSQLEAAAKACPKVRTFCGNISELYTQGVPFQDGV